jgi:hypothetical protein
LAEIKLNQQQYQTVISMLDEVREAYEQEYESGHIVQYRSMALLARPKGRRGELQEGTILGE